MELLIQVPMSFQMPEFVEIKSDLVVDCYQINNSVFDLMIEFHQFH